MKCLAIAIAISLALSVAVRAQTPSSNLAGFQCYKIDEKGLHITPKDDFEGRGFPRVFAAPTSSSKQIGATSEIVYVAWPLVKQNGFLQILRLNGQLGWVAETTLIPMHKADGTIGGCTLSRQPNGLITFKLDPGVVVRY